MKNIFIPIKKTKSIAVINTYVLIFSFIPFFIGIGYSIYISETKSYLSTAINISGSQRMRTMLLSNYSQQLYYGVESNKSTEELDNIKEIIKKELIKYNSITNTLIDGESNFTVGSTYYLEVDKELSEIKKLSELYVKNCKQLLTDPQRDENVILITSSAMELKDKFDILTNLYQKYNDKIIFRQKIIDISMLIFALTVTIYGLFMTKKIFIQERELLKAKEKAEKLATHDHLTELPNRRLLQDRVEKNILMAKKNKIKIAICVVDLDDFKQINDNYGHLAGDEILKETALRISNILREYDTVSRIGGDEFVMLLMNVKDKKGCAHVLNRLLDSIRQPFIINNLNIKITFSIGLALYPDDGKNFEELFSRADLALYDAKKNCKNGFCFYDEDLNID